MHRDFDLGGLRKHVTMISMMMNSLIKTDQR